MGKRGKGKRIRYRGLLHIEKALARKRRRTNKFKQSKWKLNYPEIFKLIDEFPYIVTKNDKRFK